MYLPILQILFLQLLRQTEVLVNLLKKRGEIKRVFFKKRTKIVNLSNFLIDKKHYLNYICRQTKEGKIERLRQRRSMAMEYQKKMANSLFKQQQMDCTIIIKQLRTMDKAKSQVEQTYETSDSQNQTSQTQPSIFKYYLGFHSSPFNKCFSFQNFQPPPSANTNTYSFTQRISQNILIKTNNEWMFPSQGKASGCRNKKGAEGKKKGKKAAIQKESRNVASNILRIFFKCMLQNKVYEGLIQKIAQSHNLTVKKQQFYRWVQSFSINYKNYIQQSQLKRLFAPAHPEDNKKILVIALRHYLRNYAVNHCLTSKKIERGSIGMHLRGIKELQRKLMQLYSIN